MGNNISNTTNGSADMDIQQAGIIGKTPGIVFKVLRRGSGNNGKFSWEYDSLNDPPKSVIMNARDKNISIYDTKFQGFGADVQEFDYEEWNGDSFNRVQENIDRKADRIKTFISKFTSFFCSMTKKSLIVLCVDLMILTGSFLLMALYKPATANYLSGEYLAAFGWLLVAWSLSSTYFKKYSFRRKYRVERVVRAILLSNFVALGAVLVLITLLWFSGFSRLMLFGTIGLATLIELFAGSFYHSLIRTKTRSGNGFDPLNPPAKPSEIIKARKAKSFRNHGLKSVIIKNAVQQECGEGMYNFLAENLDADSKRTLFISSDSRFNLEMQPEGFLRAVVNMKRVNDICYINKFFESVNRKLPEFGTFIGCAETKDQRKERILKKFPPVLNRIYYALDYLLKRVFPKFPLTKKIYFLLTRGHNRVLSKAELLGRLYSCGFVLVSDEFVNGLYCFAVKKVKSPVYDMNPTYGPFIKLRRVGKNGKIIRVYKFRTMHPYAEYLQDYLFENNDLDKGGKYRDDFRVTTAGKWMRALWIDELPMLINLLKGDVKLVGVRPLSSNYFNLYDPGLREKRVRFKPGLVPPFYADMPGTLAEIQQSELRYLEASEKSPFLTDLQYLHKAAWNIVIKKARSK